MQKLLSFLIIVSILSLAGCQERKGKKTVKLQKQPHSASSGQADLKLAVTAKFLRSDGSWYLTKQQQEITIEPKAIKITAKEPFGEIILTVRNGQFALKKSSQVNVFDKELFNIMTDGSICKALLELYLAEIKNPQAKSSQADSFMFEGQVYDPVFSDQNDLEIYKNKSTQKSDLVICRGKSRYILSGYNYLKIKEGRHFPSKIDVYIYKEGFDRKLIAQYDSRLLQVPIK